MHSCPAGYLLSGPANPCTFAASPPQREQDLFEFEATDRASRNAFFQRHPELQVTSPPGEFSRAARVAPLSWGEHCVECAIPHCYTSCDLYRARPDGKCRRFTFGIFPNRHVRTWLPYGAEIDFRVISHLWTKGNVATIPVWLYRVLDALHRLAARSVDTLSMLLGPLAGRRRPNRAFYVLRREFVRWLHRRGAAQADGFLLQVVNPHERELELRFEVSPDPRSLERPIFQTSFRLPRGFSEHWVPVRTIREMVDVSRPFEMSLLLGNSDPTLLYVLGACFVSSVSGPLTQRVGAAGHPGAGRAEPQVQPEMPHAKCVIWDLDHTIWDGVLVENDGDLPTLQPGVAAVIRELDARGILQAVASKNNHDEAWARLEELGISEYFLFPEISWGPKSEGVRRILKRLNIGADSVVFIDDQDFERAEVAENVPGVQTLSEKTIPELLSLPRFRVRPSAEGKHRRQQYRDQARREAIREEFGADYIAFLRNARIRINLHAPRAEEMDRVHELVQRTNQMNFSGTRYSREALEARLVEPDLDAFVIDVTDRFGSYGLVGFALVKTNEQRARVIDLALSCRVQAKHIEHQFLLTLIDLYRARGLTSLEVEFRRTDRNEAVAQVFSDLSFTRASASPEGRELYEFDFELPSRPLDYLEVFIDSAKEPPRKAASFAHASPSNP